MKIIDGWSPLLRRIKGKVSANGRRILLTRMINDVLRVTKGNFGPTGIDRPEPWVFLTPDYTRRVGRPFATLDLKTPKGKFRKSEYQKLKTSFLTNVGVNSATLTNTVPYADAHQLGEGNMPRRPFYPVTPDGYLTSFAENRLEQIVDKFFTI